VFVFITKSNAVGKGPIFTNFPLYGVLSGSSDLVNLSDPLDGFVKMGVVGQAGNLSFSGEINGLIPLTQYDVWVRDLSGYTGSFIFSYPPLGYFKLTRFTTDALGKGIFGYTVLSENLPIGTYPIQVAINTTSDTYGTTVAATVVDAYDYVVTGSGSVYPGCNQPGTTFVGTVENPGQPGVIDWRLVMHGSYVLGKCGGTGPSEGDWNVQRARDSSGNWEYYKNVFTSQDISDTGAFAYWDITLDPDYNGNGYHPTTCTGTDFCWWIIKSNGDSPFLEPVDSVGDYIPTNAQPNGFGFYK